MRDRLSALFRRFEQQGVLAVAALFIFPLLLNLNAIRHPSLADSLVRDGQLTYSLRRSSMPGLPSIDPNEGYTTQALGRRAALDLLHGQLPWWNPYAGPGLPLAGEMQPAALFPLVLVLALPAGMLWFKLILEISAGLATYCLLRQLGLTRYASLFGGLLYSANGSFAWLAHAPINPIPFLPLLLLGIERARASALSGRAAGWQSIVVALALSLYAGFPEVAYLNGLFASVWALLRFVQIPAPLRWAFVRKLLTGCAVGLLLAAPVVIGFLDFLGVAYVGGHSGAVAGGHLPPEGLLQLLLPYSWGQIFAYNGVGFLWASVGGYAGVGLAVLALAGSLGSSNEVALRRVLLVWVLVCLSASFGVPIVRTLINQLPGMSMTAVYRYAPPSWEFALCLLATFGLNEMRDLKKGNLRVRLAVPAAVVLLVIAVGLGLSFEFWRQLWGTIPDYRTWFLGSLLIGLCIVLFLSLAARLVHSTGVRTALCAGVVVLEAAAYFIVPTGSHPVSAALALGGVEYLRAHLGLQRFYTLGPIAPNYGAYFGIASINHNYLPVTWAWVDYVHARLDMHQAPDVFIGYDPGSGLSTSAADQLRRNLDQFESVGVKYVVSDRGQDPFIPAYTTRTGSTGERPLLLYADQAVQIVLEDVPPEGPIKSVSIYQGSDGESADGVLQAQVCSGTTCESGARPLAQAAGKGYFSIVLDAELPVSSGSFVVQFLHAGGTHPVTLWLWPAPEGQAQTISIAGRTLGRRAIRLQFKYASPVSPSRYSMVYADQVMTIYELANPRPYFSASGCTLTIGSRTELTADCSNRSVLARLEQNMSGWRAEVNGASVAIAPSGEIFQQITLPAGRSTVRFSFVPPHMEGGALLFGMGALVFVAGLAAEIRPRLGAPRNRT